MGVDINSDNIYKYIGLFVIILISVYIVAKCLSFQTSIIEGLQLPNPRSKSIDQDNINNINTNTEEHNTKLENSLLIDKYRDQYDDLIIKLNKNTHLQILQNKVLYADCLAKSQTSKCSEILDKILQLQKFNASLNATMKYLEQNY